MEFILKFINNEDTFLLSVCPNLKLYLFIGITVLVKDEIPKYHDMTLTQYSIAKRKPKSLKLLIEMMLDNNMSIEEILFQNTSNTRENLFDLAIQFGSKGSLEDSNDIRCLEVLIDFAKKNEIDIDFKKYWCKAPILTAIHYRNEDAIKLLYENNADLFYISKADDIVNREMPIITIFKMNNDKNQLENLFNSFFKDNKNKVIKECFTHTIDNVRLDDFLYDHNYHGAYKFLEDNFGLYWFDDEDSRFPKPI